MYVVGYAFRMGRAQGEQVQTLPVLQGRKRNFLEQAIEAVLAENGWTESWDLYLAAQHHLKFRMNKPKRIEQDRFEQTIDQMIAEHLAKQRVRPQIGSEHNPNLRAKREFALPGAGPEDDYIDFGEVAHAVNMQSQYASRYVDGSLGSKDLGSDLRIKGEVHDYHSLRMQHDDAQVFYERLREHRQSLLGS